MKEKSTNNIIIREIDKSDLDTIAKIVALHNKFRPPFDEKNFRTNDSLLWECNGFDRDLAVYGIIEEEGNVIGTLGLIPVYVNVRGKKLLTGKRIMGLLHPDYRGSTFFIDLYKFVLSKAKDKNMPFTWGFGSSSKTLGSRVGNRDYQGIMNESILVLNFRNALVEIFRERYRKKTQTFFLSLITPAAYSYSLLRTLFRKRRKLVNTSRFVIESRLRSSDDLVKFYQVLREKYPGLIHLDQDEAYINWRISTNPTINYESYYLYEGNDLKCYFYVGTKDNVTLTLSDFAFYDIEAADYLLHEMLNKWRKKQVAFIRYLGNMTNPLGLSIFELLKQFGFLKIKRPDLVFLLQNSSFEDEGHLDHAENWYLNGLWTEGMKY